MREAAEVEQAPDTAVVDDALPSEADLAAMVPQRFAVKDQSSADWLVLLASIAHAGDFYVNCETGDDAKDGTSPATPFRTLAKAIQRAGAGDSVHLAKTQTPYQTPLVLQDKSGKPGAPLIIEGHGATISGAKPIDPAKWTEMGDGMYRTDQLLFPERLLRRQKDNDVAVMARFFFLWNGEMHRMGRSFKGLSKPLPKPADLQPGEWTYVPEEFAFYIKPRAGRSLADEHIEYPSFHNAIGVAGRCEHVIVRDLTLTHVVNDGIGLSGFSRDLLFDRITAFECGDDGISAHQDNQFETRDFTAIGNSTGMAHASNSRSVNTRAFLKNHGTDVMILGSGTHELRDSVILSANRAVTVYNPAVENNPGHASNPAIDPGPNGSTLIMKNVWIGPTGAAADMATLDKPKLKVEVFGPNNWLAENVTICSMDIVLYAKAKTSLTGSIVAGDIKPSVIIDPDSSWKAAGNSYDLREITVGKDPYFQADFDAYRKSAGQDTDSTWQTLTCPQPDPSKLPTGQMQKTPGR